MSIKAAAIAFRKVMKPSIGARCQATANESGVKPSHSKGLRPSASTWLLGPSRVPRPRPTCRPFRGVSDPGPDPV